MAQPPSPRIPTHGAVDLSALKARPTRPGEIPEPPARSAPPLAAGSALGVGPEHTGGADAGAAGHGGNPWVVEVTEENFGTEVMTTSMTVPVVIDFWAGWCQPCKQLAPIMEKLALEYEGRFLLATIDTDANQRLAQEIGIQSLPTILAVVGQQPVPLFQGALPEAQVRQYIEELLRVAAMNGVAGRAAPRGSAPAAAATSAEPVVPHADAYEAMVAGNLDEAEAKYAAVLADRPADRDAAEGLARVQLLQRVQGVDPDVALKTANERPADLAAVRLAADVEVASGIPEAGFTRLVEAIRVSGGDDRDALREHLLSLFAVLGADDPRVITARRALASALF
ncbi:tetratricopeptide repeat protein [Sporichthya brevicatena]|uniref:Tetratricopeptide repeat protein n=1 Tax=Sporichthya brevicatena TaxID=171442 RepID=A0ABP3SGP0_9ACTN